MWGGGGGGLAVGSSNMHTARGNDKVGGGGLGYAQDGWLMGTEVRYSGYALIRYHRTSNGAEVWAALELLQGSGCPNRHSQTHSIFCLSGAWAKVFGW